MNLDHLEHTKRAFAEVANAQERKGILKYGKPLDPLDTHDWLKMAIEEQVDGIKYLVAEMEKRKFIADKLRKLVESETALKRKDEFEYFIEMLEESE